MNKKPVKRKILICANSKKDFQEALQYISKLMDDFDSGLEYLNNSSSNYEIVMRLVKDDEQTFFMNAQKLP